MQMIVSFYRDDSVFVFDVPQQFGSSMATSSNADFNSAVKLAFNHLKANTSFHLSLAEFAELATFVWDRTSITSEMTTINKTHSSRILSNVIITIVA